MARPIEPSLDEVATRWMEWKAGTRQAAGNTLGALYGNVPRWMRAIRAVETMDEKAVIGVRCLNLDLYNRVPLHLRTPADYAQGTIYQTADFPRDRQTTW
jgi:hypothetical protein